MKSNLYIIAFLIAIFALPASCSKPANVSSVVSTPDELTSNNVPSATPLVAVTTTVSLNNRVSLTYIFSESTATRTPSTTIASPTLTTKPSPNLQRISAEQLKQKIDQGDRDFITVDVRDINSFDNGHVAKSSNIPQDTNKDIIANQLIVLPKDMLIVFYDDGDELDAAEMAQRLIDFRSGYDPAKIVILSDGFNRWMELAYPQVFDPYKFIILI
jgi:rhodanese-related sulfurtransferase